AEARRHGGERATGVGPPLHAEDRAHALASRRAGDLTVGRIAAGLRDERRAGRAVGSHGGGLAHAPGTIAVGQVAADVDEHAAEGLVDDGGHGSAGPHDDLLDELPDAVLMAVVAMGSFVEPDGRTTDARAAVEKLVEV